MRHCSLFSGHSGHWRNPCLAWFNPLDNNPSDGADHGGQSLRAAEILGVRCVIVDSKPAAAGFYQRFGFLPLQPGGFRLYLPVGAIERLAGQGA